MKTFLIGYDLNKPGQDYDELIKAIKALGTWWHELDSTWLIKTNSTAVQIRDKLTPHMDETDELLVVRLQGEWASWFTPEKTKWLHDNISLD